MNYTLMLKVKRLIYNKSLTKLRTDTRWIFPAASNPGGSYYNKSKKELRTIGFKLKKSSTDTLQFRVVPISELKHYKTTKDIKPIKSKMH